MDVVMLSGTTAEGEAWTLTSQDAPRGPGVLLDVRTSEGRHCWGTGTRSRPLADGQVVATLTSSGADTEPVALLLRLRSDVRGVVVRMSDGTREDLRVVDDPRRPDLRWAVLVHAHHLDVHRVDVYDASGASLSDDALL